MVGKRTAVTSMKTEIELFVLSFLFLPCAGFFDAFFKANTNGGSITGISASLLAVLPRPRFGGPVLASRADPKLRDYVSSQVKDLEGLGIHVTEKDLVGGWILRWSSSTAVEQLANRPKPYVLGACYQPIVRSSPTGTDASIDELLLLQRAMIVEKLGPEKASRAYEDRLLRRCAVTDGMQGLCVTYADKKACVIRDAKSGTVDILERTALPGSRISSKDVKKILGNSDA